MRWAAAIHSALWTTLAVIGGTSCGNSQLADANPTVDDAPEEDAPKAGIRFVAMGDTGTGSEGQYRVGDAVFQVCAARGCDFILLLGDNIYDDGVSGTSDPQWQEKFELPYEGIDVPFYVALGNHDYGGELVIDSPGLGNEWDKGPIQVQYSQVSDKWNMPATHYAVRSGPLLLLVLDTNSILWDDTRHGDQAQWLSKTLADNADATWIVAGGHHPYRSNGKHGNAGTYESIESGDIEIPIPVPILDGRYIKSFFDANLCGNIDLYLSGHDHNRQWINEPMELCGTEMAVTGAGAKLTGLKSSSNQTLFQDATKTGFLYVEIADDNLNAAFYDDSGAIEFEHTLSK